MCNLPDPRYRSKTETAISSRTGWRRADLTILVMVILAYTTLRLLHLTRYSLWGGETFGLVGARLGWRAMLDYVIADVAHPPLFYVILKIWIAIGGEGLFWLKVLPVLFSMATVLPALLLCRELRMRPAATNTALALVAFNGYLIHYSQEVRGYAPLVFFAVTSVLLFIRWRSRKASAGGYAVALFLVNLLLIFTHYYGWLVVAGEALAVLSAARHLLRPFALLVCALCLAFLPWALLVARVAADAPPVADWLPRPGVRGLAYLYQNLHGKQPWPGALGTGMLLFVLPVAVYCWQVVRSWAVIAESEKLVFRYVVLFAFFPVAVLFLASEVLPRSFFIDRYLIFVAVPYLLAVAIGIHRIRPVRVRRAYIAAVVAWSMSAGLRDIVTNRMAWEGPQMGSRVQWPRLARRLAAAERTTGGGIPVYTLTVRSRGLTTGDWALSTSLGFFLAEMGDFRFRAVYAKNAADALRRSAGDEHFWVAFIELEETGGETPLDVLRHDGLIVDEPIVFAEGGHRVVLVPAWRQRWVKPSSG